MSDNKTDDKPKTLFDMEDGKIYKAADILPLMKGFEFNLNTDGYGVAVVKDLGQGWCCDECRKEFEEHIKKNGNVKVSK